MTFAKIEDNICTNILFFDSVESALSFDETLVELEEGYSIGDIYDGSWSKRQKTDKEKIKTIKAQLKNLDTTINRATEDLYILTDLKAYDTVEKVILRKEELRKELQELTKVGE